MGFRQAASIEDDEKPLAPPALFIYSWPHLRDGFSAAGLDFGLGIFCAAREDVEQGQRQMQPQVLRLRYAALRMTTKTRAGSEGKKQECVVRLIRMTAIAAGVKEIL